MLIKEFKHAFKKILNIFIIFLIIPLIYFISKLFPSLDFLSITGKDYLDIIVSDTIVGPLWLKGNEIFEGKKKIFKVYLNISTVVWNAKGEKIEREDIKELFQSYLLREIRDLKDVEVVNAEEAEWELHIVALELENANLINVGFLYYIEATL